MNPALSMFRTIHRKRMAISICVVASLLWAGAALPASADDVPVPLLETGKKVDWWFVYKFNSTRPKDAASYQGCGAGAPDRVCKFGGNFNVKAGANFSQQYVFASNSDGKLAKGKGCLGMTLTDPVGATFDQIYNGSYFFVIWNDQFYGDPKLEACGSSGNCEGHWGHSKGMLAWNDAGEGMVLQVTTPSWPGAGSIKNPRKAGNTLGCVNTQNNLNNAQHFFALKLNKAGVLAVLDGLANASVVTKPTDPQLARLGGPADIRQRAEVLGAKPMSKKDAEKAGVKVVTAQLSDDVMLISKPSNLYVPPWQMVSALLNGESERAATWWAFPQIYSTNKTTKIGCWEGVVKDKKPGAVDIALNGNWQGNKIGLIGGLNHAKIGVTTSGDKHYAIFGDLNQQGTINPPNCDRSQNGRGGLFFVVENKDLFDSVSGLLEGESEPVKVK
jgi:hypothetical protein